MTDPSLADPSRPDQLAPPVPPGASAWAQPSPSPPRAAPVTAAPAAGWQSGVPLGGVVPEEHADAPASPRRDLLLTAILLIAALAAGACSLLSWRDVGRVTGGTETGWQQFDGSLGRGWVAVVFGVLLAVAGVLVAAERERAGRTLAVLSGVGLVVFSVLEWGLGLRNVRTGPGPGLWGLFAVGLIVVFAVGVLAPEPRARGATD